MKGSEKSEAETKILNEELEQRHYEFASNCNDGKGDPVACHSQAEWFAVVDKNYKKAAEFYDRNCTEKKYVASCFNLGRLHLAGKDVEQSDEKAAKLFAKACDGGHVEGCDHLGTMYLHGMGLTKDAAAARKYLHKACDSGEARSCYRLASLYLNPKAERNIPQAKTCLEKACDANFAPACHNLAVMYKKGDDGIDANQEQYQKYRAKTKQLVDQIGSVNGIQLA